MGSLATAEALLARWDELCRDPALGDLPYKIEHHGSSPLPRAPEICVEVFSPSSVQGEDHSGEKPRSGFPVVPALPDPTMGYP